MAVIKRRSLSEQVFSSIIDYVQNNGLKVGDKLPTEGEFSELFQVSRTSVREAMKALGMNGAIEAIPGKGTFIRPPMLNYILKDSENPVFKAAVSITQIMEVRTAVELLAADLAIERATEADIERVSEAMESLRHAVLTKSTWAVPGSVFHIRIAESSRNPIVVKLVESYADAVAKYRDALVDFNTEKDMGKHIAEHQAILDALIARDRKAMHSAVKNHMESTQMNIMRMVDENSATIFFN